MLTIEQSSQPLYTVLTQSRVENKSIKITTCTIWFKSILVVKFLVNSTPVHFGLNTKQEWNYDTIILFKCIYLF